MRATQYIGINSAASNYLVENNALSVPTDNKTCGMFGEDVPLKQWILPTGELVTEIEQCSPWSSGPMIFTCLLVGDNKLFEWKFDSCLKQEYNVVAGTYNV